jgi:3-hydroxybutyryl-CoA dehydrogenase
MLQFERKGEKMDPREVKKVVVVGAGTMGHSIAQVFAQAGIEVNLMDVKQTVLDHALQLVRANLKTLVDYGKVDAKDVPSMMSRIHVTTDVAAAAQNVDFALEAVVEIPEIKKKLFAQLEEVCPPHTVLASNTSGLEIFKIIEVKDPSRAVVAHWFAPPHIIPLVEVVPGPQTSPEVLQFTSGLMARIGKKPVVMNQFVQRFIVNRIQNAMAFTALEMIANGWAKPEEVDLAVKSSIGIRMPIIGILQSLDFTGLGLVNDINKSMGMKNLLIEEAVKQGHLGASTSKGIYDYGDRTEEEILRKRDILFLKMLDHMESIGAFKPV